MIVDGNRQTRDAGCSVFMLVSYAESHADVVDLFIDLFLFFSA